MDGSAVKSVLAVLPEDPNSVPSTPQPLETLVLGAPMPSSFLCRLYTHAVYTHLDI